MALEKHSMTTTTVTVWCWSYGRVAAWRHNGGTRSEECDLLLLCQPCASSSNCYDPHSSTLCRVALHDLCLDYELKKQWPCGRLLAGVINSSRPPELSSAYPVGVRSKGVTARLAAPC